VVDIESERAVQPDSRGVVGVDEQHRAGSTHRLQVLQPGDGEGSPEAEAVELRVHGDDVDLADERSP